MYLNKIVGIGLHYKDDIPDSQSKGTESNITPVHLYTILILSLHEAQYLRSDVDVLDVSSDLGEV